MQPIQDILNQIKWDKRLDPKDFKIGYEDKILKKIIEIPYNSIKDIENNFMVIEKDNKEIDIPLHRIRSVKQKDKIIWKR
ncbi:DUF504 domain-containing protein [Candidatus Woesearchaeota archaeon]|nr:DUF504 domain-containing protein [Candidatus Woesearchaeota archaeon]